MSKLGKRMIEGLKEARAIVRGEADPSTYRIHHAEYTDLPFLPPPDKALTRGEYRKLMAEQKRHRSKYGVDLSPAGKFERTRVLAINGQPHLFASKREAQRYDELVLLQQAGKIRDLELQPAFGLTKRTKAIFDFSYVEDCKAGRKRVIEDVKGKDNAMSKLKRTQVEDIYSWVRIKLVK